MYRNHDTNIQQRATSHVILLKQSSTKIKQDFTRAEAGNVSSLWEKKEREKNVSNALQLGHFNIS